MNLKCKAFLVLFAFLCFSLSVCPAVQAKNEKIGVVLWDTSAAFVETLDGLKAELAKRGYQSNAIEVILVDSNAEKAKEAFTKFNNGDYSVIVSSGTPATKIGQEIVKTKPLVFFTVADPKASGFIKSWASSGNNITGTSIKMSTDSVIATFLRVAPNVKRIGLIRKADDPVSIPQIEELKEIKDKYGFEIIVTEVKDQEELKAAAEELSAKVDAFFLQAETLISKYGQDIVTVANKNKKPTVALKDYIVKDWGATVGYAINSKEMGQITGEVVDKLIKGAKPSDIPVELPNKLQLIINNKAAQEIGLEVPIKVLRIADEIIE